MPLASTVTFGDVLLSILEFALLFFWIWIAVTVIFDVFRSSDLSNWGKALWLLFILFIPLIGVLVYLIVRGHTLHEHQEADVARAQAYNQFVQSGGSSGPADDLNKLADLKDRGILTDAEFEQAKAKVLAS